jgi:hypothetical protein
MPLLKIVLSTLLIVTSLTTLGSAQSITIPLDSARTPETPHIHFEVCSSSPPSGVILPKVNLSNGRFLETFYASGQGDRPTISIMLLPDSSGEWMYVDRNYNDDLSDDGPPILFPFHQSTFIYDIVSRTDSLQKTRLLLARTLEFLNLPDTELHSMVDGEGNMLPSFVKSWSMMTGNDSFRGAYGSFYWDDRLNIRPGVVTIDTQSVRIGILDWSNNGIFNDSVDQVIVAYRPSEELSDSDPARVYAVSDVIPFLGSNWVVSGLDRYGRWITFEKTDLPVKGIRYTSKDTTTSVFSLDEEMWTTKLEDINGHTFSLEQLRGSSILLNIWGEWCRPCLAEIPELVETASLQDSIPGFKIVSVLKAGNLEKAKTVIRERGVIWPQYLETDEISDLLKIRGYPTNILIFPDGKTAVLLHSVDKGTVARLLE